MSGTLQHLIVDERVIMDAEQICSGTFAPLKGFVSEHELDSILANYRLPNGEVWPLPVLLPVSKSEAAGLSPGERVTLVSNADGHAYATIEITDIFTRPLSRLAFEWFGSESYDHPGVRWLAQAGEYYLGGPVKLLRRRTTPYGRYEYQPHETRKLFKRWGWTRVVGFHTRNVVHKAHEKLLERALTRTGADGVFVSPVIGHKKPGDFNSEVILKSYELVLSVSRALKGKFLLGGFSTYSRYSGPREAVFTALCRRNFGCTHFIVGRDHTGVGQFYQPQQSQELFRELGDIGIEPVFFETIRYCPICDAHVERKCQHALSTNLEAEISGSAARDFFKQGKAPPSWMMRPEVSKLILAELSTRQGVFVA